MTTALTAKEATAPVEWPARRLLLVLDHPNLGDQRFAVLAARAVAEYAAANPNATTTSTPFISTDGVMVRFHAPRHHNADKS